MSVRVCVNSHPLFPGRRSGQLSANTQDDESDLVGGPSGQLNLIFDVIGSPSEEDLSCLDARTALELRRLKAVKTVVRNEFRTRFPGTGADGIALLEGMLQFDPSKRITVDEALAHPFLAPVRARASEVSAPSPMSAAIESIGESREHLYENVALEVRQFRLHDGI